LRQNSTGHANISRQDMMKQRKDNQADTDAHHIKRNNQGQRPLTS
jgi:hypothetical protein